MLKYQQNLVSHLVSHTLSHTNVECGCATDFAEKLLSAGSQLLCDPLAEHGPQAARHLTADV